MSNPNIKVKGTYRIQFTKGQKFSWDSMAFLLQFVPKADHDFYEFDPVRNYIEITKNKIFDLVDYA